MTIPSGFEEARIHFFTSSTGFCVGCFSLSQELFDKVGISNTSFGFAPLGLGVQTQQFPLQNSLTC